MSGGIMAQIGWQSRYTYTPQHDPIVTLEDLDVLTPGLDGRLITAELVKDIGRRIMELEARPNPGAQWGWATDSPVTSLTIKSTSGSFEAGTKAFLTRGDIET